MLHTITYVILSTFSGGFTKEQGTCPSKEFHPDQDPEHDHWFYRPFRGSCYTQHTDNMSSEQEDSRSTAEDQGCTTDDPPSAIIECGKITQNFTIVKLSLLLCDEPFVS